MSWPVLFLLFAAAEPTPASTPTPVPAVERRLGEVKLRSPGGPAGKAISSASGTAKPGGNDLPEREEVPKTRSVVRVPKVPDHLDRDGHGESWWRERAARARRAVEESERALRRSEAERAELTGTALMNGGVVPADLLARLQARVDEARERLARAARDEERLQDEARRADAYPGWLR